MAPMRGSRRWLPDTRRDLGTVATRMGLALTLVLALAYPFVSDELGEPLTVFVLPPLLTAVIGGRRETMRMAVVAIVVATVVGVLASDLSGVALAVRVLIVAAGGAVGVVSASVRAGNERSLDDASLTTSLLDAFQERLIPRPHPPGTVNAVSRYRPGDDRLRLGGDFLDVVTLPDGTAAFIVGDVCGHGATAAAFGVAVRAGWKGIAMAVPERPEAWLDHLERAFFTDQRYDSFVTALVGRLDPNDRSLRIASAGHPWPILVGKDAEVITMVPDPPLGLGLDTRRQTTLVTLERSEVVFAYTDGLIENRRHARTRQRWDEADLLAWLRSAGGSIDLDALLTAFGPDGYLDDVAALVLSLSGEPDPVGPPQGMEAQAPG
jgi:Stage II sporulation protein E (SpoIIE)